METTACVLSVLLLMAVTAQGQAASGPGTSPAGTPWERIAPYLTPPAEFRDQFGNYPDVRRFDDQTLVAVKRLE